MSEVKLKLRLVCPICGKPRDAQDRVALLEGLIREIVRTVDAVAASTDESGACDARVWHFYDRAIEAARREVP